MGANSNLRVLDAGVVRPSDLDLPPHSLPLTFFDVKWLRPPPVQRLFLYRLPLHNHDTTRLMSDLKASLSKALDLFYPLAGHVRLTPDSNRYELFYQPGDGVAFTVAEYDADLEQDLANAEPAQVAKLAPLVPSLPKGRAVLAVQATVLLGGVRGLALGVTLHHSACDGASSTHFLHTWAALCAGAAETPPPPVIDRTLIADPRGLYDIYSKGMPSDGSGIEFVSSSVSSVPDDQLLGTFTLPQELLRGIKDTVAREAARHGAPPPRCSSLLATFSFMWSCYCRAKQEHNQTKKTYFLFSVDHRTRLKPPVPDRYLGNCLGPAIAAAHHDELAAPGTDGLFAAFMAIASALQEEVGEGSQDRWDGCVERVKEAAKAGLFSVAGSPRFRVYGIDFGFGPPAKVDVVSVAKTGAMSMAEARDGHGGIEVGISLPTNSMEHFRRCFADDVRTIGMPEKVYI
ncbi:Anthocyanin 5-aromatic acyltransferase [Hordeum vulgare]|nr:Anthocyanin 5-aromatic acyltransferase [Hordeum vulgare]